MNQHQEEQRFVVEGVAHIDYQALQRLMAEPSNQTILIDVREPEEYDESHIPGIPLIPMGDVIDYIDQFDKARSYVLVCRSGRRSLEVAKFFRANGIEHVMNFDGGMLSWKGDVVTGLERIAKTGYAEELERTSGGE